MACDPIQLRTDRLPGADPGGTWSLVAGTYTGPALTGDNPTVDVSATIPLGQTATFRYSGLDCDNNPVSADVTELHMDLGEVTSFTETLCNDALAVTIFSKLSGRLGAHGTLAYSGDIGNAGFAGSGTSATFDPSLSGLGTFTFTATITANPPGGVTYDGCCDPVAATYTVTVNNSFNAGTGGTYGGC